MIKVRKLLELTTAAERSYLSRVSMKQAEQESELLRPLYDGMMKGISEARLKHQLFDGNKNLFSFYLNKLQNFILDSLLQYEGEKYFDSKFNRIIGRAFVLKQKGLLSQARVQLKKAEQLAEAAERYDLLLNVLHHESNLEQGIIVDKKAFLKRKELDQRKKILFKKADNTRRYGRLFERITYLRSRATNFRYSTNALRQKVAGLSSSPLLQHKSLAISFESVCLFHLCKASLFSALQQVADAKEEYRSLIQHIGSSELHLPFYKTKLRYALNQYLNTCIALSDFTDFDFYLKKMEALKEGLKNADLARYWLIAINLKLNRNFAMNCPQNNLPVLKAAEKDFQQHVRHVEARYFSAYFANGAITYFHQQQFKKALPYINNILNAEDGSFNAGVYTMMKLLNMGVHTELKNKVLMSSLIRAALVGGEGKLFQSLVRNVALVLNELERKKPDEVLIKKVMVQIEQDVPGKKIMEDCFFDKWLKNRLIPIILIK